MANVELQDVVKRFSGDVCAVNDLTIAVNEGEFLVLLGPSGCGKTTVLRLIAGLERVTSGKVFIGDQDVTDVPARDRDIAMVFQNYALYPHMTAYENIAFGMRMRKIPSDQIESRVEWAARILDIADLLGRRPKALSGGERQRIALGRALVRKPEVFLFDEPLSNLDARLRVHMRHEIVNLHRKMGTTAIYVTHDQFEAMTMGDRIAVLNKGVLQQVAEPELLYRKPKNLFVARFIGTPAINIISGKVETNTGRFISLVTEFPLPETVDLTNIPDSNSVLFGLRPEMLSLENKGENIEIRGQVERIELLGGEFHLYMKIRDNTLVMRKGGYIPRNLEEGGEIRLYFNPRDGIFFDGETSESLEAVSA